MQWPIFGVTLLIAALVFGQDEAEPNCLTTYALKKPSSVKRLVTTITFSAYGATETITEHVSRATGTIYVHLKTIYSTYQEPETFWETIASTTTTVPMPSNFTPLRSARNATAYPATVTCNPVVITTVSSLTTTRTLYTGPPAKTVTDSVSTSTVYSVSYHSYTTTSTVHTSIATAYEACQTDNLINKFDGSLISFALFNQASGNGLDCYDGSYHTPEACLIVRAARQSPEDCCTSAWNLYYHANTYPVPFTFQFNRYGCLGQTGYHHNCAFFTGPENVNDYGYDTTVGNGPGGVPYFTGYLSHFPGFSGGYLTS